MKARCCERDAGLYNEGSTHETHLTSRSGIAISLDKRDLKPTVRGKGSLTSISA